ncbi:MAG: hypothetical protein SGJ27_10495 [Candidatus Melainabacteria bacterium]|mgnify:CR=1 FL=1|nr:hypothetical protein [Candidatus Melainabacteria bacterium]
MSNFADTSSSLFVRTGRESCEKFLGKFLDIRIRPFVLRVTGGCGLMGPEHAVGLRNVQHALTGGARAAKSLPRFTGFCLFGGTRMVNRTNPRIVVPGITEVVPPINRLCSGSRTLGIIAKVGDLKHSRHGIIVSDDCDRSLPLDQQYVTIAHPTQHSILLVQPSADRTASWDDEAKECIDICDHLRKGHWKGLLLVYNGGGVVEREIKAWAELGKSDPFWQVLIVKGSGRTADKFACDADFMEQHKETVHSCGNSVEEIREALLKYNALVYPPESLFRRK